MSSSETSAHPTLEEMRAMNLPRVQCDDIFEGDLTDGHKLLLNEYLRIFALSPKDKDKRRGACICCGTPLTGLVGSFQWGIAHGEGFCSVCRWPARAYHEPKMGPVEFFQLILPYHPDELKER